MSKKRKVVKKKLKFNVDVEVELDAFTLTERLIDDDLLELIKDIDLWVCNWDFTKKLHAHFSKLMEEYDPETDI